MVNFALLKLKEPMIRFMIEVQITCIRYKN